MRRLDRTLGTVFLAAGAAILPACGGNGGGGSVTGPSSLPTPPPIMQTVVAQGSASGLQLFNVYVAPTFTTTRTGRLDVTVDWTFARNDVDAHLARGACEFIQFILGACEIVAFSESTTAKPERLTVPSAAAGVYTLLIPNFGPGRESISYQVVLTTGGGAASGSAAQAATPSPEKLQALRAAAGY